MALIFIVDDDRDFLELQERMLSSQGYRVSSFSSPDAALAALRTDADLPGLLVTDLMMSALDSGFSLARAMKADPRLARIPVIVVSAVASQKGFDFRPRTEASGGDTTRMPASRGPVCGKRSTPTTTPGALPRTTRTGKAPARLSNAWCV